MVTVHQQPMDTKTVAFSTGFSFLSMDDLYYLTNLIPVERNGMRSVAKSG